MTLLRILIEQIDANLMRCLIPLILTLIIMELLFTRRFETRRALKVVCYSIIFYTILTFVYSVIGMLFYTEKFAFIKRATGAYAWAYWIMVLSALFLPLTLFNNKLASKFWYVLFVTFFMKIGFYFERFVIIVTSFHRDYPLESTNENFTDSMLFGLLLIFMQGITTALILLFVVEFLKKKKNSDINLIR